MLGRNSWKQTAIAGMEADRKGHEDVAGPGSCVEDLGGDSSNSSSSLRWRKRIEWFNKKVFKNKKLEPKELLPVLNCVLSQRDCLVGIDAAALPGKKELCYLIPAASGQGVSIIIYPHKSEIAPFQDEECGITFLREQVDTYCRLGVPAAIWGDKEGKDNLIQDLTSRQPKTKLLYVLGLRGVKNAGFLEVIDKIYKAGHLQRICLEKVEYLHDNWEAFEVLQMLRKGRVLVPALAVVNLNALDTSIYEDFQEFANDIGDNLELGKNREWETFEILPDGAAKRSSAEIEETLHTCDHCFHVGPKETTCQQCDEVYYCDRACQKAGWFRHKDKCKHS